MPRLSEIRDPIYGPVAIDPLAEELIDTPQFQRLRRVQQLSLASLVHPSAVHTRFEHSLGVYHLTRTILQSLESRGELHGISEEDRRIIPWAGLLHDAAQALAVHLLEEYGLDEADHEDVGAKIFQTSPIAEILEKSGIPDAATRVGDIVTHRSTNPLAGIVAGNADADKMDYIRRDAYHTGVMAGFDQHHLRDSLVVLPDTGGVRSIGLEQRGLPPFEQMLYVKSILYRTVYFHRVVRSAMAVLRKMLVLAIRSDLLDPTELSNYTDAEVFTVLKLRLDERAVDPASRKGIETLLARILDRRLFQPQVRVPLADVPKLPAAQTLEAEQMLAREFGLREWEVALDFPHKPTMLATDILVRCDDGAIRNAQTLGPEHGFALNEAQTALYQASGQVTLFAARTLPLTPADLREIIHGLQPAGNGLVPSPRLPVSLR